MGRALELMLLGRPGERAGATLPGSLVLSNADTWYDATGGDFATLFDFTTQPFTMEAWVKVTAAIESSAGDGIVWGSIDDVSRFEGRVFGPTPDARYAFWTSVTGNAADTSVKTPLRDVWTHVAGTWAPPPAGSAGNGRATAFMDGVAFAPSDPLSAPSDPTNFFGFRLGAFGAASGYDGMKVAEVRLWDVVRSDAEIAANYQSIIDPAASNLVALYASAAANTGTVSTIADEAGANDMSRQNSTSSSWDTADVPPVTA